ncbi:MAG TPA: polyprenyl synthetase family protein [Verrucomicrobiae bacterium]|nr:polyprenyl synthetase family protein [Verrucomicrobiae bacterium]
MGVARRRRVAGLGGSGVPVLASHLDLSLAWGLMGPHLAGVDAAIRAQAASFDPGVVSFVVYACESRGKRLRAALAILTGGAAGEIRPGHTDLAVIVELIHLASLVHDDVMDRAETRRGGPTAGARWGPETAVLLGDCLFAHALKLCTRFDSNVVSRRIADAASDVCQGEILQTRRQFDLSLTEAEYRRLIGMKTGALFAVAAELGAELAGASVEAVAAFREYGARLGLAYQMYDDCLDLVGTEQNTGKTLGTDLEKGKFTLPVLLRLAEAKGGDVDRIRAVLLQGDPIQRCEFIAELHATGCFCRAVAAIREELSAAAALLDAVKPNPYVVALRRLLSAVDGHIGVLAGAGA